MKLLSYRRHLRRNFLLCLITFCFSLTGVSPSFSSESVNNIHNIQRQLLEINAPSLPPLRDSSVYLYSPDEVSNFQLVLRLKKRVVEVYEQDQVIASFPVAVGREGWETPQGEFEIIQMVENPSWQNPWTGKVIPPGPTNPLGERWIGFWTDGKNFIGFHGTPGEHLIGQAVSHGCVRMRNKDIKELFKLVSMGTPVKVVQ
ncbi:L,D-transpeptidase [Cyanobacterium aponinum]|uniref:L,D-transpeptidase n=1 Tax=Cyanobacterium aponinum TaxID=379064 RepID=UPI000C129E73|nr:L,D-transpeptidase [Cyanobacterium aponinum]PHV64041.1 hypothetical protein CSQ80_01990 [Cyanobacterium aponinum IPPAS B-1201]